MLVPGACTTIWWGNVRGLDWGRRVGKKTGIRQYVRLPGINPGRTMLVHNNTLRNLHRGVVERVLYLVRGGELVPCPRPSQEVVMERMDGFRRKLMKKLPIATPVSLENFSDLYRGRKRLVYAKACQSLNLLPLTIRDATNSVFVKYEKLDATVKVDPAPRVISPPSPRYNASVGTWLKPNEKPLFQGIARVWGSTTVAKGLNAAAVASLIVEKWEKYNRPVAVGLDASRFDQHVSYEMLRYFEHLVYRDWFRDSEFNKHISWQLENRLEGYTKDGWVKATVRGCRMSGHMNTSSGNCLIMCGMVWAFANHVGVKCDLVNNGDDCVVIFDQSDLERFTQPLDTWFSELGFEMKVEPPAYELEHIEFCQAKPVQVAPGSWLMVRTLERALARDSMGLIVANHPDMVGAWASVCGSGGLSCYGGVPVLDALYRWFERQGTVHSRWAVNYDFGGMQFLSAGMNRRGLPIEHIGRYSFHIAFGLLPAEQIALESYFDSLPNLVRSIPSPALEVSPDLPNEYSQSLHP